MVWECRHLKMLKRAGRAYDPTGVNATAPGELAIQCCACPIPGVNLSDDWEDTSLEKASVHLIIPLPVLADSAQVEIHANTGHGHQLSSQEQAVRAC